MLKRKLCEAMFQWKLTCDGPLLIADGRYDHENLPKEEKGKYPHKVFISHTTDAKAIENAVKTKKADALGLPFYVPGTSLRGPFRAYAERIIRSLLPGNAIPPRTACNPFDMDEQNPQSCSKRLNKTKPRVPYVEACPACRLFGCTGTASRIQFTDADIAPGYSSVYRDMIGIDRFTGGVYQGANMRFHALEKTTFTTTITVTNFELWQLGLLAYVFRDFQEGLVPIGFGKTKGFGHVKGQVDKITLTYPTGSAGGKIQHLGSLVSSDEREHYGLDTATAASYEGLEPAGFGGLSLYETLSAANQNSFWAAVAPAFNNFIKTRNEEANS